ncbi:molybdenum cofactor sulfurase isoform X2 [Rhynchophorus ferrugineus]|uniref:molybdenum cofactor sulfurase isoform X2 n=1 Tax=Rhynchophorus ferrugineus TaxID=354439 RepID=UPI003FCC3A55
MDQNHESKVEVYSARQKQKIAQEFRRLNDVYYLDHAGATLYSETQLDNVFSDLSSNIYGNPHARNTTSQSAQDAVDIVRYQILNLLHVSPDEYSLVFTSGATQALKLVAETFDFDGGMLCFLEDNHTSVLGMRQIIRDSREVKIHEAERFLTENSIKYNEDKTSGNSLFVYPAESNFAGTKYPLDWIESIKRNNLNRLINKNHKWFVLLDAACFAATNDLNLHEIQPDFVAISFYKIFGYPTGLGALLVRKDSEEMLQKRYLGGGTVLMALSSENVMIPRPSFTERFEDGTLPFLSIMAIKHGLDTLKRLGLSMDLISRHTFNLAKYVFDGLASLRHSNNAPVAVLYHDNNFQDFEVQGAIVNFNLRRSDRRFVGYAEVLHIANLYGIQLRTGCFCNPGACQRFLNLTVDDVRKHFDAGHVCGDQHDLVDDYPTGSVRVSFGYMSTYEDADKFLEMIRKCFVDHGTTISRGIRAIKENTEIEQVISGSLRNIFLYPVKSCGSYSPQTSWELTETGLKYDRRWMIVNAAGACMSQKQIKQLCLIRPILKLRQNRMLLTFKGVRQISLPLEIMEDEIKDGSFCNSKICGSKVRGYDCGDEVADWLSETLNKPGLRLLRQCDFSEDITGRTSQKGTSAALSLANQAQYLLINLASIRWLKDKTPSDCNLPLSSLINRFRANFLVEFDKPFVENSLNEIHLGNVPFKFSGKCTRCQMICIDQETGTISKEPLQTLSKELEGNICFGVYLSHKISQSARVNTKRLVTGYL